MAKVYRFKVRGRGEFPFDMLRYDSCWPETSGDVHEMFYDKNIKEERIKLRDIMFLSNSPPTKARWSSFMWSVVSEGRL